MNIYGPFDSGFGSVSSGGVHTDNLRRAWNQGHEPELEAFLATLPDVTVHELAELIRVDLQERWSRHDCRRAEDYLIRFRSVAADPELAVDVIYAEYLAREQAGQRPDVAEYQDRFPKFGDALAEQIWLHCALDVLDEIRVEANQTSRVGGGDESLSAPRTEASYEILEEIGRGGMGVVYKARQPALNRFVALKMVRTIDAANVELLARFRSEGRVVASLHHPNIVQVYDFGEHDGLPYLAMELIESGTLAERLNGRPWPARAAADLVVTLAGAVHYAHERHVIHRDLKPANVLVVSDAPALEVKIADFGLAKVFREDCSNHTKSVAFLGTPSYMAPEQVNGSAGEVGPATDVYSLGAILYELLTGRPPFRGDSPIETLRQRLATEPIPIDWLAPHVPRDLATICDKCLRTDLSRRYASAAELRTDLERYLAGMPINARSISAVERGWLWCRRNRMLAGSSGFAAFLLLAVSIISTTYSSKLSRQLAITRQAELAERKAKDAGQLRLWEAHLAEIAARNSSRQQGQRFAALDTIEQARRLLPAIGPTVERQLQLRNAAIRSLALPDLRRRREVWSSSEHVHNAAVALAARRIAFNVQGASLVLANTEDGKTLARVSHDMPQSYVMISPDGRLVALTGDRGTRVWNATGTSLQAAWQDESVHNLTFAPDGRSAVAHRSPGGLTVIDADNGNTLRQLVDEKPDSVCWFHEPSNRLAAHIGAEAVVLDWKTGEVETRIPLGDRANVRMAWYPTGEALAVWASDAPIEIWNLQTGEMVLSLQQRSFPQQLHFTADGAKLVSCGLWDSRLAMWDVGTGQKEFEVQGFDNLAMDLDAAGNLSLFKYDRDRIEAWEVASGSECRLLPSAWFRWFGTRYVGSISPDNRLLALSGERGLELWDLVEYRCVATRPSSPCMAQFDRRGDLILAVGTEIHRWPRHDHVRGGAKVVCFGPPAYLSDISDSTSLAACSPDDRLVFETASGWQAMSLDGERERVQFNPPGDPRKAALSYDGTLTAIAGWEAGGATVWSGRTGTLLATLESGRFGKLEFSLDGRWLATTPNGVQLWRSTDWSLARNLRAIGNTPNGLGIAFAPDSRVLAIGQTNGEVRLVNPETGADWASLLHPMPVLSTILAFTSDHRKLVCLPIDESSYVRVWNLAKIRGSLAELELDWPADVLAIGPTAQDEETELKIEWNDAGRTRFQNAVGSRRAQEADRRRDAH